MRSSMVSPAGSERRLALLPRHARAGGHGAAAVAPGLPAASAAQPARRVADPCTHRASGCHCSSTQAQPSRAISALDAAGPQLPAA